MELKQYTITKHKPYFNVPVEDSIDGVVLSQFKPDLFNPNDELKVVVKKELRNSVEGTTPLSLMDFKEEYVDGKKVINFRNENDEKYLLITLMIGKTTPSGKFLEIEKLDPDKIGEFKIHLEYKYPKTLVRV